MMLMASAALAGVENDLYEAAGGRGQHYSSSAASRCR
jgi:hypothetical protein